MNGKRPAPRDIKECKKYIYTEKYMRGNLYKETLHE